jgi:hypothetical protein
MLVPLRRWLSVPHMSRRSAGLSLLIALAVLLQLAAGVGLAYVAGFPQVSAALGNIRWVWLCALVGALFVSFAGYHCAYQGIFRVEEGPALSRRQMCAVVVAGFGGFFAHGRGALDQYVLEAAGTSRRDARVRATRIANAAAASSPSQVGRKGGKSGSYDDWAKPDLLRRAREIGIKGRSTMTKAELIKALRNH